MSVTSAPTKLPPYSHELEWPEGLVPYKVIDDNGSQGDPYAHYQWMRANAPVLRCYTPQADVWYISRYDDVRKAMRAPKIFSSQVLEPAPLTFLTMIDDPYHTRLRAVVARAFAPKAVAIVESRVGETAEKLLDDLIANGGGDVVARYCLPLSLGTISGILDVPSEDLAKMKFWSDELFSYFGRLGRQAPGTGTDEQSAMEFFAYLTANLERLYATKSESVGGHIARQWKEGLLTEKEATELCSFMFVAGHETTTLQLANMFFEYSKHPELLTRIRETPKDAELFIEELLRYRGAVHRVVRKTTEDVEVAGVTIPAGSAVRLLNGSANRDETKFPNADTLDIDRDTSASLGFGHGIHSCVGAPLARLEKKVSAQLIAERIDAIELDAAHPVEYLHGNSLVVGPEHLHVKLDQRRS
ncbi:cytochrome P450 [Arthrobacter globiformis]|uniref:cytochrome P450 n=1 Tax=Arthrobacter globiformis TaxID=1665 RepID=UPI002792B27A|nr:cytochrome P450 [Arthrobacter globiformis]MDQ0616690.1 cytochrome P450 [Arthrobacter globiformis]